MVTSQADLERLEAEVGEHKRLSRLHRRQAARKAATLAELRQHLQAIGLGMVPDNEGEATQEGEHGHGHEHD